MGRGSPGYDVWSKSITTHGIGGEPDQEEHAPKRAGKRSQKGGSPQKKKKQKAANASKLQPLAAKVPPVRVSDSGRRKIIVLNVVGLLYDIRPLHDRREWGLNLVIHHVKDLNVKIRKTIRLRQVFIDIVL